MTRMLSAICLGLILIFTGTSLQAAGKVDLIRKWLPFTDDIVKFGKTAPKATKSQMDDMLKRFPRLAGRNPELINGVIAIERATQKAPGAGKFIESGVNPARVARIAQTHPEQLKLGNEIGEMFARNKPKAWPGNVPAQAKAAANRIDGNYARAGESFLEMAARGGNKAVDVADKLYKVATSPSTYALLATGLLAWHMADPEGAEQAVEEFFSEHVAPMVNAPVQGIIKGGGHEADQTLNTIEEQGQMIWDNHWKLISTGLGLCLLALLFIGVPNFRRLLFAAPNALCGKLLNKVERKDANRTRPSGKEDTKNKINIYGRRK